MPPRSHDAAARLHVRQPTAGPQAGSSGSPDGPPGQPPLLEILLGPAAGDARPQDRGHGARLLGSDGVTGWAGDTSRLCTPCLLTVFQTSSFPLQ